MRIAAMALAVLLLSAVGACAQPAQPDPTAFMAQNALAEGVRTLPSGVQYKVLKSGPATGARPTPDDEITVNYEGALLNGQIFDSSFKTGKPATFHLSGLIPGWIDALQQMRPGDEWIVYVPPSQGYGAEQKGPIPGNSVLVFRLQLLSIGAAPAAPAAG
ncbi:MAG TPA: FKBP-type peptidyl-prolyl cis-trans isomerase [Caulobacteraceae bacterium]